MREPSSPTIVLELAGEGGGIDIHGEQHDGDWVYWKKSTSMYIDEPDDAPGTIEERWVTSESPKTADLVSLLHPNWPLLAPRYIAPHLIPVLQPLLFAWLADAQPWMRQSFKDYVASDWQEADSSPIPHNPGYESPSALS